MSGLFDKKIFDDLRASREKWEQELKKAFDARPERLERFATVSDQEIERIYTPEQVRELDFQRDIGFPGQFPFTRGCQPSMYRGRLWTMRMFAGLGTAKDTNERFHHLVLSLIHI